MAIRYRKFSPNEYVIQVKKGRVVREGPGLAVLYNTMNTALLVVPATAVDAGFVFDDILTADYQSCCVQGSITYRFREYAQAASILDLAFAERPTQQEQKRREVLDGVSARLSDLAKVALSRAAAEMDIRTALKSGDALVDRLRQALAESEILKELGIEILSATIVGVSARPDTRKALEAAAREQILKEQDDAIYMRRNAAIDQERQVRENELDTEIRVAEKAREKKERELQIQRIIQEQELQLEQERMESRIALEERNKALVLSEMENERRRSVEKAYAMEALMKAFETVDPKVLEALAMTGMDPSALIAKAFLEIGGKAERIGNLNVTPDLLGTLTGG